MEMTAIGGWHDYLKTRDDRALSAVLHPDIVFESPVVYTPQRGREITVKYLSAAAKVLGGPNFRYVNEWRNDTGAVLELQTEIDGIAINAVDIVTVNGDGSLITHFKVMVRPLEAIKLLHRLMGEQLAKA